MARVMVAIPTFETIYADTYRSVWDMDKGPHQVFFESVRGYDVATARNRCAQIALDNKCDYVLMVDNDVVLPKKALMMLLENRKQVCLGYYAHRGTDNRYTGATCICRIYKPDGTKYFNYDLESEYTAGEMIDMAAAGESAIECHGGGMGCALIHMDVFRRLSYPWYDWVNYGDAHRGMLSEDLYFCSLCATAGIKIYADVRVGCGHLFRYVQWPVRT